MQLAVRGTGYRQIVLSVRNEQKKPRWRCRCSPHLPCCWFPCCHIQAGIRILANNCMGGLLDTVRIGTKKRVNRPSLSVAAAAAALNVIHRRVIGQHRTDRVLRFESRDFGHGTLLGCALNLDYDNLAWVPSVRTRYNGRWFGALPT